MIETERLLLRRWRTSDLAPFAALNADPVVMEHLPGPETREDSDASVERIQLHFQRHGYGLYAAELKDCGAFIGYIGLAIPKTTLPFSPCVEIGWRLAAAYWNRGLATEGARAVLRHAFTQLHLAEVVSFTVPANLRSRRVMEKIGLHRDAAGDFDHPRFPEGHRLRRHVLYRLENAA
jgi:RimJ/RimL family protein N-acetyltransferase